MLIKYKEYFTQETKEQVINKINKLWESEYSYILNKLEKHTEDNDYTLRKNIIDFTFWYTIQKQGDERAAIRLNELNKTI